MKRLKLEDLEVESFATSRGSPELGTVRAHQESFTECVACYGDSRQYTCANWEGCGPSGKFIPTCQNTCPIYNTCHGYPTCRCEETGECA